jgi:sugar lactone lactonase YvrE
VQKEPHESGGERLSQAPASEGDTISLDLVPTSRLTGAQDGFGIDEVEGMAADNSGQVYISDQTHHCIWKVSTDGAFAPFVGQPASDDEWRLPSHHPFGIDMGGLAVGADGSIFFTDLRHHRICRALPDGGFEVVAGSEKGFADGPAASALFHEPTSLACDHAGNLFVADKRNKRIRKITPDGEVSTVHGAPPTDEAARRRAEWLEGHILWEIGALAVDERGNLLFSDLTAKALYRLGSDGHIEKLIRAKTKDYDHAHLPGVHPAVTAALVSFRGVGFDEAGNLFAADLAADRVVRVGDDGLTVANANDPELPVKPMGSLFVRDDRGYHFTRLTADGGIYGLFGGNHCFPQPRGPASSIRAAGPLAFGADGQLYLLDSDASRVYKIQPDGAFQLAFELGPEKPVDGPGENAILYAPGSLVLGQDEHLYVAEPHRYRIRRISPEGSVSTVASWRADDPILGGEAGPGALAVGTRGETLALFPSTGRILAIRSNGEIESIAEVGALHGAWRLERKGKVTWRGQPAFIRTEEGGFIMADEVTCSLRRVDARGRISESYLGPVQEPPERGSRAFFSGPYGVAAAPDGRLLVGMWRSIVALDDSCAAQLVAELDYNWRGPWCLDAKGSLYVLDSSRRTLTIARWPWAGAIKYSPPRVQSHRPAKRQQPTPKRSQILRAPGDLPGRVLTGLDKNIGLTELVFGDASAFMILDDPHGGIETGRPDDRDVQVTLEDAVGATVTQVSVYCRPGNPNPILRSLAFSNGVEVGFYGDVGRPLLLPERASPSILEEVNPHQAAGAWMELAGQQVHSAEQESSGLSLALGHGRAKLLVPAVKLLRKPEVAGAESEVPIHALNGLVITLLELIYEASGHGAPVEVRLMTDALGELTLRHPDRPGLHLVFTQHRGD